jgi:hypothetical protein
VTDPGFVGFPEVDLFSSYWFAQEQQDEKSSGKSLNHALTIQGWLGDMHADEKATSLSEGLR